MEPRPEIKNRVFPNCGRCGAILAQCDCAAARDEATALSDYMLLRTQIGELEEREHLCECGEFYTCDLCREERELDHQARHLMDLWGDHWAMRLWSFREEASHDQTFRGQGPEPERTESATESEP